MAHEEEAELDALLQALANPKADGGYPLPEEKQTRQPLCSCAIRQYREVAKAKM